MSVRLAIFTLFHVAISLLWIGSGWWWSLTCSNAAGGPAQRRRFWPPPFSPALPGSFFTFLRLLPSHVLGVLSPIPSAIALYALYGRRLTGAWQRAYTVLAVMALYLNVFVAAAQRFLQAPALKAMAPTPSGAPFGLAQAAVLPPFARMAGREQAVAA